MEHPQASRLGARFLVAAFDRLAAAHLTSLLRTDVPDADIVAAHSAAELEIVLSRPFDLVVLDTRNIENPAAVLEAVRPLAQGGCRVAMVVIDESSQHLRWAVNARQTLGYPQGIMPATMTPEQFRAAVVHVATGHEYWSWALMGAPGTATSPPAEIRPAIETLEFAAAADRDLAALLTPREAEILPLLKQGLRNKEVAERLAISVNTAKIHIASIKRKYRVSSRMQFL